MSDELHDIHGVRVLVCAADGKTVASGGDANDLLSAGLEQRADMIALPVARLAEDFFRLRTGLAGEIAQKFVNYAIRLTVIGDIARHAAASTPLRDFVHEANKGPHPWFVADMDELRARLATGG